MREIIKYLVEKSQVALSVGKQNKTVIIIYQILRVEETDPIIRYSSLFIFITFQVTIMPCESMIVSLLFIKRSINKEVILR